MRSFRSFAALPQNAFLQDTAVAIGKFDGVHRGHQAILAQLQQLSAARQLEPCVFTFTENPLALLQPEKCPRAVASSEQRLELLAEAGVSAVLMVDFTRELAALSPAEFVEQVLVQAMRAKVVLVGRDFRFGARGAGDTAALRELGQQHGIEVIVVSDVLEAGERISATRVRDSLAAGDVQLAAKLLGRPQRVRGLVVHGAARGRDLGFRTANLAPHYEGFGPADGVYACIARVRGKSYAAAVSVGGNPTFTPDAPSQIEVHLLDFEGDIYGEQITVDFISRLRGMTAYTGLAPLIHQMHTDVEQTAALVRPLLAS